MTIDPENSATQKDTGQRLRRYQTKELKVHSIILEKDVENEEVKIEKYNTWSNNKSYWILGMDRAQKMSWRPAESFSATKVTSGII